MGVVQWCTSRGSAGTKKAPAPAHRGYFLDSAQDILGRVKQVAETVSCPTPNLRV